MARDIEVAGEGPDGEHVRNVAGGHGNQAEECVTNVDRSNARRGADRRQQISAGGDARNRSIGRDDRTDNRAAGDNIADVGAGLHSAADDARGFHVCNRSGNR